MKGIIMDIKESSIIIMAKDGQFIERRKPGFHIDIGQEIDIKDKNMTVTHIYKRAASLAAALIVFVLGGYGVYGYYNPFGYITVDINPSVEMEYNLYRQVIEIRGLNTDGVRIVSKIKDYKNKSIDTTINLIIDEAAEENYVKSDDTSVVLLTINERGRTINSDDIYSHVENHVKAVNEAAEVVVLEVDNNTFETAKSHNISPGKLMLVNKALEINSDVNQEDLANKSVKEIMSIIKDNRKEDKEAKANNRNQNGQIKKDNDNKNSDDKINGNNNNGNEGEDKDKNKEDKSNNGKNNENKDKGDKDNSSDNDKTDTNDKDDDKDNNEDGKDDDAVDKNNNGNGNNNKSEEKNKDTENDNKKDDTKEKNKNSDNGKDIIKYLKRRR